MSTLNRTKSAQLFARNSVVIPGGVMSLNRKVEPQIAFVRGKGAYLWDADGNRYIDYHAGFAPYLLGHGDSDVDAAVVSAIESGWTNAGSGTTPWEGQAAEMLVSCVPSLEQVQFTTSGSEATFHALRLARAATGRNDVVVMQGGYNGWHDDVACNVMTPLDQLGPEVSAGQYPYVPMSAGMPMGVSDRVHVIGFNDLDSVRWAFETYSVAALITEPVLQNIGVVKPDPGYLQGLRDLCTKFGVVLVFDEVKTGFRHGIGGYQSIAGVAPDLSIFGKAIANGYPLGVVGGRENLMSLFTSSDPSRRVMIAGTYNGHPVTVAPAIATMKKLIEHGTQIYGDLDLLGQVLEQGLRQIFVEAGIMATVVRQGSASCVYFMDHAPRNWHDIAQNHDMNFDVTYRQALIERGIYQFPLATKQGSISAAHSERDIDDTLERTREVVASIRGR